MKVLFWNVNKNDCTSYICDLAMEMDLDVVILCENREAQEGHTLRQLQSRVSKNFFEADQFSPSPRRFQVFGKDRRSGLQEKASFKRCNIHNFRGCSSGDILVALVHGADPRNYDIQHRNGYFSQALNNINSHLAAVDSQRLIVLGDFNLNPFDTGVAGVKGFNANMSKSCVRLKTRTFLDEKHDFYYNPMWSLLGDNSPGPPGTIYDTSSQGAYGWNMFDQVLIHHSLLNIFDGVKIVTQTEKLNFQTSVGLPDGKISDHFPIIVTLKGFS